MLAATLATRGGHAADPIAESMFQEAIEMMKTGGFEQACPRLEASKRLEPKSGTLIVLGSCYENTGRTASAWAQYKEAAAMARAEGREEHIRKATELARDIEPRLSKLRLDAEVVQGGAELTVTFDGRPVPSGQLGVAFAIDPGEHTITASAPGRVAWSAVVTVEPESEARVVVIPRLDSAPMSAAPGAVAAPAALPPRAPASDAPPTHSAIPVWAWACGAAGIALGAVGVGFAIDQGAAADAIEADCGSARDMCSPAFDMEGMYAREKRDFGLFVGFGMAGMAALGAGVLGIVLAISGDDDDRSLSLAPLAGGALLEARF